MRKSIKFLVAVAFGCGLFGASNVVAAEKAQEPTTRSNAVIFKIHDINPVLDDGIVTGCDFTVTLYNRTAINFRSFTINMQWEDVVAEQFKFDRYLETILDADDFAKQKEMLKEEPAKPLQTAVTVNAFGSDKQISVRSHVNSEKCYLLLQKANYTVTPCDIVRNVEAGAVPGMDNNQCSALFQLVSTSNPEYFGQFKKISLTEEASQNQFLETQELSDIDVVISKIVENLGTSDKALTNIN